MGKLDAQLPAAIWKGGLTQVGVPDTFSYELHLEQRGNELSGKAFSVNAKGVKVQFAVKGTWDGQQMLLQEWKQEAPATPRWCLKYVKLNLREDGLGQQLLSGNWRADGCNPGKLWLYPVQENNVITAENTTASRYGRWTGHLDQADREYGFFYEVNLQRDGKGFSQIVSEESGGTARHELEWYWDSVRQVITIVERKVLEKTDPNWPWCIKQAELQLVREPGRQRLSGDWSGFIEGFTLRDGACASGKMYLEKPVVRVESQAEILSQSAIYEQEKDRKVRVDRVLQVNSNKLRIRVWDNGTVDGDIVTVFLNGEQIVTKYRVSKRKWSIPVTLTDEENLLIIHADDLGDITPNTVAVSIDDGTREEVLVLSSDLRVSGGVLIQPFKFKSEK
ncbi:hypothetical protein [Flavilitoribacter nigricans]|uniref:Uncharacterized protein n=1 Tax=Flavilitoribacter nigricans (strain ATCC 23147 / DSM 23189 / NBRC 102662 / NCIMB 1420 / SS-2) TaxID=1122177 RepID=A0A2D0MZY6_FLAN2|nr:hypothetical protein [Flavilitoribacter nigricans]PHN01777.1 hypothetical protein CRP01_35410 [Flavilitoribacter nigricans DSM 23189 = NBRC 102662]